MANKRRLIDANALIAKLEEHSNLFVDAWQGRVYMSPSDKARVDEIDTCIAEIISATTADAVEVVRCKDCVSYNGEGCLKTYGEFEPDPMFFCSYGERKDNG